MVSSYYIKYVYPPPGLVSDNPTLYIVVLPPPSILFNVSKNIQLLMFLVKNTSSTSVSILLLLSFKFLIFDYHEHHI